MREIKFRYIFRGPGGKIEIKCWSLRTLEMGRATQTITNYSQRGWENIAQDQLTGLKDKNGKEIYEGDILLPGFTNHYTVDDVRDFIKTSQMVVAGHTVAGNIYENPELIK